MRGCRLRDLATFYEERSLTADKTLLKVARGLRTELPARTKWLKSYRESCVNLTFCC